MGSEPEIDRSADQEDDQGSHPGPCVRIGDREKTKDIENVPYEKRDQAQKEHLLLGQGEAYVSDQAENEPYQQKVIIPGDRMRLNQNSNDEQQGKSRFREHETFTTSLVLKIEKPNQQNYRQYDDKNIQHDLRRINDPEPV